MTRQPSWQQKISSARRVVETNLIKMARQTSMKLKRMTSTSSTSQRMNGLNEEHLLPVQRVTVQLVDEHLVEMEVPLLSRCLIWKGFLKDILKFKLSCLARNIILGFTLNYK